MLKSKIAFTFTSQSLAPLCDALFSSLYEEGSTFFEPRLIAVPHLSLKPLLTEELAKRSPGQICAGCSIISLSEAWSRLSGEKLPSHLELSFFLQETLALLIPQFEELSRYFSTPAKRIRIGPFSDSLSSSFLRYGDYGAPPLSGWQGKLWEKVRKEWKFPIDELKPKVGGQVHLFGFSHLPSSLLFFFREAKANCYFFSPCSGFWGEHYTGLADAPEWHAPLLSSWGKVGREQANRFEDLNIPIEEIYTAPIGDHALAQLQRSLLSGEKEAISQDSSIEVFSAPSLSREVEALKERLLFLFAEGNVEPKEVQVFAPQIEQYAPFISLFFSEIPHGIFDLPNDQVDEVASAFEKLITLPKKRFSKEALFSLIQSPPFAQKGEISEEDLSLWKRWTEAAHIEKESSLAPPLVDARSWGQGLRRLILGIAGGWEEGIEAVSQTEIDRFNRLYCLIESLSGDLAPISDGTTRSIPTWLRYFSSLAEKYLKGDSDLSHPFLALATQVEELKEPVTYPEVERAWRYVCGKGAATISPPHLQSIRFRSLAEGAILPSKVIALLGMEADAFPRKEERPSFLPKELSYAPKREEWDRFTLLRALHMASDRLLISYSGEELSLPIQELLTSLEEGKVDAIREKRLDAPRQREPLIPSFYTETPLSLPEGTEWTVHVQELIQFVRHPVRFYLEKGEKIALGIEKRETFLLSPYLRSLLGREAVDQPLEEVMRKGKLRGELPPGLCFPLAKEQIEQDADRWREVLEEVGTSLGELKTSFFEKEYLLEEGKKVVLKGKVKDLSSQGILWNGEDPVRSHFYRLLSDEVLGIGSSEKMKGFLRYFLFAKKTPSPFVGALVEGLLQGSIEEVEKGLEKIEKEPDSSFAYLLLRDPLPKASVLVANWSELLGGIYADI